MILAGLDPATITIEHWVPIAWTVISDQAPVMANPFEYRDALWSILYKGEQPAPTRRPDPPSRDAKGRLRPGKPPPARKMSSADRAALAAFTDEVRAIKERKTAEAPDTRS